MAYKKAQDVWRIRFALPRDAVGTFETAFEGIGDAFVCFGVDDDEYPAKAPPLQIDLYSGGPFEMPRVHMAMALAARIAGIAEPEMVIEHESPRNWLEESFQAFPPIRAGRFFIHGSHWTERPPSGSIPLMVDAATAFGSGEHQSTFGCLMALDGFARCAGPLKVRTGKALDMGCGSGILGLAMARRWKVKVVATDIDEESVRVTRFNAKRNGVASFMDVFPGDGFKSRSVKRGAPYDVICANILARPLCSMARDLKKSLAPGGRVVLAGLLMQQESKVLAAYRMQGLSLIRRIRLRPWVTLVLG